MAKQTINIGTAANDGTGDPLRTSFTKTNQNFTELYDKTSNVDNTSDASKPVSTAQAAADAAALAAAQAYADSLVIGLLDDRGNYDASVNAYPSSGGSGPAGAIKKGDVYLIVVGGTFPTGQAVSAGDSVRALIDTPGNIQANWAIQKNGGAFNPTTATIGTITPVNTPIASGNTVNEGFARAQGQLDALNGGELMYSLDNRFSLQARWDQAVNITQIIAGPEIATLQTSVNGGAFSVPSFPLAVPSGQRVDFVVTPSAGGNFSSTVTIRYTL
jgi:hypothetical protein